MCSILQRNRRSHSLSLSLSLFLRPRKSCSDSLSFHPLVITSLIYQDDAASLCIVQRPRLNVFCAFPSFSLPSRLSSVIFVLRGWDPTEGRGYFCFSFAMHHRDRFSWERERSRELAKHTCAKLLWFKVSRQVALRRMPVSKALIIYFPFAEVNNY